MSGFSASPHADGQNAPDESMELLSPDEFTGFFAACLQRASPEIVVKIVGELELETGEGKSNPRKAFLDNAYSVYLGNPQARDDVIDGFVASHLDLIKEGISETVDIARVVPVVKDKAWVEGLAVSLATNNEGTDDNDPSDVEDADTATDIDEGEDSDLPVLVHESLNSELDVVYAEDSPHNIRYLNSSNLEALGIDRDRLRARAVANLTTMLEGEVEVHGGEGVFLISAGGNYEPSFLLFDAFWESQTLEVEGDYVVAIPTRDLLLVTGSTDEVGIARVREVAGDASAKGAYSLTPVLFVRKNGSFEVFEG